MVAEAVLALVRGVVLLVDHDQAEVARSARTARSARRPRSAPRRARSRSHCASRSLGVSPLCSTASAVAEAAAQPRQDLVRERDLGHEHERLPALRERRRDRAQVDLRLAAAGDAVEQEGLGAARATAAPISVSARPAARASARRRRVSVSSALASATSRCSSATRPRRTSARRPSEAPGTRAASAAVAASPSAASSAQQRGLARRAGERGAPRVSASTPGREPRHAHAGRPRARAALDQRARDQALALERGEQGGRSRSCRRASVARAERARRRAPRARPRAGPRAAPRATASRPRGVSAKPALALRRGAGRQRRGERDARPGRAAPRPPRAAPRAARAGQRRRRVEDRLELAQPRRRRGRRLRAGLDDHAGQPPAAEGHAHAPADLGLPCQFLRNLVVEEPVHRHRQRHTDHVRRRTLEEVPPHGASVSVFAADRAQARRQGLRAESPGSDAPREARAEPAGSERRPACASCVQGGAAHAAHRRQLRFVLPARPRDHRLGLGRHRGAGCWRCRPRGGAACCCSASAAAARRAWCARGSAVRASSASRSTRRWCARRGAGSSSTRSASRS